MLGELRKFTTLNQPMENDPYEIIPGILEQHWSSIEQKFELVRPFAKTVHIDIIDGEFAPNTTFLDPAPFKKYSTEFFLELHMMVKNPLTYLERFADAGFRRFLGHVEHMPDQEAFVATAQSLGEVGLVLDGPTSHKALQVPFIDLDTVLCYTSEKVGFSGPPFMEERLDKVAQLRKETDELFPLEVDGGITDETIVLARNAGATRFVSTSFLFKTGDPAAQFARLKDALIV